MLSESTSGLLPGAGKHAEEGPTDDIPCANPAGLPSGPSSSSSPSALPSSVRSFAAHCRDWREALLADEDWRASIVRISGKGLPVLAHLPGAMALFEDHITTIGERATLRAAPDYARRFVCWWRCLGFRPAPAVATANPAATTAATATETAAATATPAAQAATAATIPFTPSAGRSPADPFPADRRPHAAGRAPGRCLSAPAPAPCRAEEAIQTSAAAAGIALQLIGEA